MSRLFEAASHAPDVLGISGPDRAMLYRLAVGTGFRAGELRRLTPESFRLDDKHPGIKVAAAYSKRRRDDLQPIRSDLAAVLGPWLAGKAKGQPVFSRPEKTAEMLRHDLEAAKIAYKDESGQVADFHALRHTFVSMVVRSGANVKVAQELARHSTPTLTIGLYTHMGQEDQTAALSALPSLFGPKSIPETPSAQTAEPVTIENPELAAPAQRS